MNFIDLTGQKFSRLTVTQRVENAKDGSARWLCCCECGCTKVVTSSNLRSGHAKSCGCLQSGAPIKHGKRKTRLYATWHTMKHRCYNQHNASYAVYGGRGVTVCEEWKNDFRVFYDWAMSHGYKDNLTLDRIDTNGNYEPSNCRWATMKEQQNNKSNNHYITHNKETHTMAEWARDKGINYNTLKSRLRNGWEIERALSTP